MSEVLTAPLFSIYLQSTQSQLTGLWRRARIEACVYGQHRWTTNRLAYPEGKDCPFTLTNIDAIHPITIAMHVGVVTAWSCRVHFGLDYSLRVACIKGRPYVTEDSMVASKLMQAVGACGGMHTYKWSANIARWTPTDY
jgi:hypothetical protein